MQTETIRGNLLDKAKKCVCQDRQATHGEPEDSFGMIAKYWSIHLGIEVSPTDVPILLGLLKIARLKENPTNEDNWIDMAGYAACGGELAARIDVARMSD